MEPENLHSSLLAMAVDGLSGFKFVAKDCQSLDEITTWARESGVTLDMVMSVAGVQILRAPSIKDSVVAKMRFSHLEYDDFWRHWVSVAIILRKE